MTELNSTIQYEKHFIVDNLRLPHEMCDIIKDYCFYDVASSEKINFIRSKKREIVEYFEGNVRFYDSIVCYTCGNFQMIVNRTGGVTFVPHKIRCKCNETSMWL